MQWWMIGFIVGVIAVGFSSSLLSSALVAGLLAGSLALLRVQNRYLRFLAGLGLGCVLATFHGQNLLSHRLLAECVKLPVTVTGEVISLPALSTMVRGITRQRFEFEVATLVPQRCARPRKLMLSYYGDEAILPGQIWEFEAALKKPWGLANPGSHNIQGWFAQQGIDAVGSVRSSGVATLLSAGSSLGTAHQRLRHRISTHIAQLPLSEDVVAILRAITVADKNGISKSLWLMLQSYGINHLLVISGLHIGLVAGVGVLLGGLLQRILPLYSHSMYWWPLLLGLLLATAYAALAGFTLPTQRALCMLASFVLARMLNRHSGACNNLLLAAVLVLLFNPLAALGSGFWLSFGAVAALLWFGMWHKHLSRLKMTFALQAFISLVMLPLGAWFFGGGSLVAMAANLLMIPLIGFVVVPLALLAAVCYLSDWSLDALLWHWAGWPLEQILPLAELLQEQGASLLYRPISASLPEVLLALLGLTLVILPLSVRPKILAFVLIVPFLLPARNAVTPAWTGTRITVLDVGQGTAVLVQSGERTLLYDTGGGDPNGSNLATTVVLPFLRQQGIRTLDTFVISHPDQDHSAGAGAVLQEIIVGRLRYGRSLEAVAGGRQCSSGEAWRWPTGEHFQFLSPAVEQTRHSNNSSCVLQIQSGPYQLLLAGDIEKSREHDLVRYWRESLRSSWLLAAHHGSKTSSSWSFLKHVQPQMTVFSSGYANRFGHPHPLVVSRVEQSGSEHLSTASGGALIFTIDAFGVLTTSAFRNIHHRYWM
ncbi:MAG: competence protein ComEC [Halioglobus sp.]|jgi:competence protein ComEC